MNKLTGIITLGIAALIATPVAEARDRRVVYVESGYRGDRDCDRPIPRPTRRYVEYCRSCDGPAYIETYVAYFNDYGDPVYRTRVIPVEVCRPAPPVIVRDRDCDRGPRVSVEFHGGWR